MAKEIPVGARGEAEQRVELEHTLAAWREELPPVYATPRMIGLMEAAAFNALTPYCDNDEVNVGTAINVVHRAPTTVGATVKAEAVFESYDGRFYTFRVSAHNGEEVIGYGTVGRAVVKKRRFAERYNPNQKAS